MVSFWGKLSVVVLLCAIIGGFYVQSQQKLPLHVLSPAFASSATMKAAVFEKHGGALDVLTVKAIPLPSVGPHDVLIRVRSAALNPVDWKIIKGYLQFLEGWLIPAPPKVIGMDVSGVVTFVGSSVSRFHVNDKVFGMLNFRFMGALAEYVAVEEGILALLPEGVSFDEAASVPLVALTTWQGLVTRAALSPGQRLLVLGGSGGTGSFGVQLGRHLGATVIATCSGKNEEFVRSLGATQTIDYTQRNFSDALSDPNDKVDVVYDTVGGLDHWDQARKVLKPGGIFLSIAGDGTPKTMNPSLLVRAASEMLMRSWPFTAFTHRQYTCFPSGSELEEIGKAMASGSIRATIDSVFTLDGSREAFARLMTNRAVGKVVVRVSSEE